MKRWLSLALAISVIALSGCDNSSGSSDLPVETKKWVTTDGYYQFYTNDNQNLDYMFWYPRINEDTSAVFNSFTGVTKKMSGSPDYAYGFLFCYTETDTNVENDNFYYVLISTHGRYKVGKRSAKTWSTVLDWTASSALKAGMKAENIVTVTRTGADFSILFNGVSTYSFTDATLIRDGFAPVLFVGPTGEEDFPNNPVDVRFKFTSPILPSTVSAKMLQVSSGNFAESSGFAADIRP